MRRSLLAAATLAALALSTSAAIAATPPATMGPLPPTPAPPPAPGRISLAVDLFRVAGVPVALDGQGWRVVGTVSNYVPGQTVRVTFSRGGRTLKAEDVLIRPDRGGRGTFSTDVRLARPGRVRISAVHEATPQQVSMAAGGRVEVILPYSGYGSGGLRVRYLQRRLRALGFWVRASGRFDDQTARAVIAFRKVNRMARGGPASGRIYRQLARGRGGFVAKYPGQGRHVEADLGRQVLALVNPGGRVYRVYHISSGKPSTPTVLGTFYVFSKTPGYNSLGMLDANYFAAGGYALHGYHEVPTYAASHGCIRAPIPDAPYLFRWVRYGTRIDIYERGRTRLPRRPRGRAGP